MIDFFPVGNGGHGLGVRDFHRFSLSYAEILKQRLPTAKSVTLVEASLLEGEKAGEQNWASATEVLGAFRKEGRSFIIAGGNLHLPFFTGDGALVIAIVEGADPVFLAKVGADWLEEVKKSCEREFLLLKEARCDLTTGLLNLWNLHSLLGSEHPQSPLHLLLIELLPKRMSCRYGLRHTQRCATLLLNFLQRDALLHHIGNSIFALVLPLGQDADSLKVERALLSYLKREGCHRVHIGSSMSGTLDQALDTAGRDSGLLHQAWTALRQAEKRGPFCFCAFPRLAHPETRPLQPPMATAVRRLASWARSWATFGVALFSCQHCHEDLPALLGATLTDRKWLVDGRELAVFLPDVDGPTIRDWADGVLGSVKKSGKEIGLTVGICSYPCGNYSKAEVLFNCRKALYHASFLDGVAVVACDAVSLNLSGDVYFSDGDLARAVDEYRHGLIFDEADINLHNSLGVTLAMMDKLGAAKSCFEKALRLAPHNFMALYNIGLAEQAGGRLDVAYGYLEEALRQFSAEEAGEEVLADLQLQVGILAGDLGYHQRALKHLSTWKKEHGQGRQAGKVCFYLGRAYAGMGEQRQAMAEMQRALQFNEFDDRAMSLLGALYLEGGEGDEIALSLCRKSVELEPGNDAYRRVLAEAQIQCRLFEEAWGNLRWLLARRKCRGQAQLLMGRSYLRLGEHKPAKAWFGKALRQADLGEKERAEANTALELLA